MHKCCTNCANFHCCLGEYDSQYHIHDYCEEWDRTDTCPMRSKINRFLDDFCVVFDELYDDHETGESYCYLFTPGDVCDDENLCLRFEHNKALALELLDDIIKSGKAFNKIMCATDKLTYEELEEFKKLRAEIEKEFFQSEDNRQD